MFFVLAAGLLGWMGMQISQRGPRAGLWAGWMVVLLVLPVWFLVPVGALQLDLRTVAAAAGLAGIALLAAGNRFRGFVPADWLIAALVLLLTASEYLTADFGLMTAAKIASIWLLPYIVGRCFLRYTRDVGRALDAFAWALAALALYSIAEAVTGMNPASHLIGKATAFASDDTGYRMGLKRAQAFLEHPIYLGYLLALMIPWSLEARRLAKAGTGASWWKFLPPLVVAALFCTGSRGPLFVGLLAVFVPLLFANRSWRKPALFAALAAAMAVMVFQQAASTALTKWAGESEEEITMTINGRDVPYTGTSHRVLQIEVYQNALAELDPLGYGSELNGVDFDDIPPRFRSVDSHYLFFLMQRGYLGMAIFLLLTGVTLFNLFRAANDRSPLAGLSASLFGAMAGIALLLGSVWFAPDFGAAWLFTAGLAGSLRSITHPQSTTRIPQEAAP